MAISKKVDLKIKDDKASLSEKIILYKNDKGIDIYFKIMGLSYMFTNGINSSYVGVVVKKPSDELIALQGLPIANGEIKFSVTADMIDDLSEVGTHEVQFQLYENSAKLNKITIPSVNIEIKEPI